MSTADEVNALREQAKKRLAEWFEKKMFDELSKTSRRLRGKHAEVVAFDEFEFIPQEPTWIRNLNANQRRKKFRFLTKKWETQIAVEQVKARLNGRKARDAEALAVEMEERHQQDRRAQQALRTPRSVPQTRPVDGRGVRL